MRPIHLLAAAIAAAFVAPASAQSPRVVMEEMMVPAEPGIEIYVRNKRPADMTTFRPERTLLYVHGATYPASTAFDLQLDGMSWMDYVAGRGYDVYLLDLRGYGKSSRPKEMEGDTKANPPIVRSDTAVKDIGKAVDFILAPQHPAAQPDGLVVGHGHDGDLHHAEPGQGRAAGALCAGLIRQTASLVQAGPGPLRRLPNGDPRPGAGPLMTGAGGQEGDADSRRLVRGPGRRDLRDRPRRRQGEPAPSAPERRGAGQPGVLGGRQGLLRSGQDHGADSCWCTPSGTATGRPTWRETLFPLLVNSPGKRYDAA